MAVADLVNKQIEIDSSNDNVVIVDVFQSVRGGRTLDVTGYPKNVINAGHVIIKDSAGEYKPMPLNESGNAYAELPEGTTYAGILIASIFTKRPFAGIMLRGTVNYKAAHPDMTTILEAVKTSLPLISFVED